jgi:hypothetical protein
VRRIVTTFFRLIGLTILLYASWVFFGNLVAVVGGDVFSPAWTGWVLLEVSAMGMLGGVVFLLSLDGPPRWRTSGRRLVGWLGMLIVALLPSQAILLVAPIAVLGALALFIPTQSPGRRRGRHLITSG